MRRPTCVLLVCAVLALPTLTLGAAEIPDTAEGTVHYVAEAVADGHPEVIWHALPASYQQDIQDVTKLFAEKMDRQLWQSVFGLFGKAATVLDAKKELFMQSSMVSQASEDPEKLSAGWDTMTGFLADLSTSQLADLDLVATMDWEEFLADSIGPMVEEAMNAAKAEGEDPAATLRDIQTEVISSEGDRTVLKVTPPGEEPEEITFARVEGRWVPAEMADEWDQTIQETRTQLEGITEEQMVQARTQAMMFVGMAQGLLDQVAMAETPEQIDQMLQGMLGPLLGGMGAGAGMAGEAPMEEAPAEPSGSGE